MIQCSIAMIKSVKDSFFYWFSMLSQETQIPISRSSAFPSHAALSNPRLGHR